MQGMIEGEMEEDIKVLAVADVTKQVQLNSTVYIYIIYIYIYVHIQHIYIYIRTHTIYIYIHCISSNRGLGLYFLPGPIRPGL